ncbi:MAG: hypothetical protein AUJ98_08175 [Bacteroidetes bacterium CG2_30_33_31]|nr:MAG: hypothetical protein AUJ98_08175 [Bacteroidetes bacterium CG2_30_33_31]
MRYLELLFIIFLSTLLGKAYSQELNCQVSINHSQISSQDVRVFQTLQKSIYELMNNRRWTDKIFKPEEKIECSIFINIKSGTGDMYSASIQVQSRRPIFNTSYNSVMINHIDNDLDFEYLEYSALDFQTTSFQSNLTSVLGYYAYIILGLDFDSYENHGGTPYFNLAQQVVNNAQNAKELGWKSFESQKNRYWLIENILNGSYDEYRNFMYSYHRLALDQMYENVSKGRTETLKSLQMLTKVYRARPGLYILNLLLEAKKDEIIGVFSDAPANEKTTAKNYLIEIDPAHSSDYQKMVDGKK